MEIVKNKILKVVKNNVEYIIGCMLLTYKGLLINAVLGLDITIKSFCMNLAIPAILMLPCLFLRKKRSIIYLNVIYALSTLIIYSNYVYYNFSTNYLSLYQFSNIEYSDEIGMSLQYLVTFKSIIIFWLDNIVLLVSSIYVIKKEKKRKCNLLEVRKKKIYRIVFCIIVFIYNFIVYFKFVIVDEKIFKYNKSLMVQNISIYYYHIQDLTNFVSEYVISSKSDVSLLKEDYKKNKEERKDEVKYNGIASGKNVIIVQLESLHEYVINKKINGVEITPNLNKFYNENIYCTNMYNQGLGSTADSEHSLATSMYPLENGRVYQKYYNINTYSLYYDLKNNGYYTSFMHPNINTFWNRNEVYNLNYKVNEYNDINSFEDNGQMAGKYFSDEQFLLQSADKMSNYTMPFSTTLVTISTHIPFSLDGIKDIDEKIKIDVSSIKDEEFKNYIRCCNFVDYSFGKFMEKLNENGLVKNSIIVVYGDHGAGIVSNKDVEELFSSNGINYTDAMKKVENVHVPFGMSVSGLKNIKIDNSVSKIDIKPTILGLLGIKDTFSLGESIFSNKDYSFIKDLGFVTKDIYYINGKYIDRKSNNQLEEKEEYKKILKKMERDMNLSDSIIKNNCIDKIIDK